MSYAAVNSQTTTTKNKKQQTFVEPAIKSVSSEDLQTIQRRLYQSLSSDQSLAYSKEATKQWLSQKVKLSLADQIALIKEIKNST